MRRSDPRSRGLALPAFTWRAASATTHPWKSSPCAARCAPSRTGADLSLAAAQAGELLRRQVAPAAEREVAEQDVHDANALERHDLVAERFAHPADLPVEALHEDDLEHLRAELAHLAAL